MIELPVMEKRQRNIVRVAACAAVGVLLIWIGAAVAEEGTYPVKLNPRLGLASVDDAAIDARLRRFFWPGSKQSRGLDLYRLRDDYSRLTMKFEEAVLDQVLATNCIELKALTKAGYAARFRNEEDLQFGLLNTCEAIEMLRRARPARISYVRDFVMSAEAVNVLPVMLDNGAMFGRLCEEFIANRLGVAWSNFDKIINVEVHGEYGIHVLAQQRTDIESGEFPSSSGGDIDVSLLVWADFNGDGVEDMLIESGSRPVDWLGLDRNLVYARNILSEVYIVTRHSPEEVLRVIDAERYLAKYSKVDTCEFSKDSHPVEESQQPTR